MCILSPFGSRVHAPWALALETMLSERHGFEIESMYTDDGIVLRFADAEELPSTEELIPPADEVEDMVIDQVGNSSLFASAFRENAARSLLLPKRRANRRSPLWQQRLRAKNLLAAVRRYSGFPVLLETYRQCLRDVFDVPALIELLLQIEQRIVRVEDVETPQASPFARSLAFAYVAQYLYEQDAPLAERRAQALTLDRELLRELLGETQLRELLDPVAIEEVEWELQALAADRRARDADELHDLLRRVGDLTVIEIVARAGRREVDSARGEVDEAEVESWLDDLERQRRACRVRLADEERWIATEDGARLRDALGTQLPVGLPEALLDPVPEPLIGLVRRYARTHGPFLTAPLAARYGLLPAQVEPVLQALMAEGALVRGEIRPTGSTPEWCDSEVLRRIKRRTLGRLRDEVAPVDGSVLGRFLPRWQSVRPGGPRPGGASPAAASARLSEVVAQLEGRALPWSTLSQEILPARIEGFDLDLLDMLAATGEVVWVGCGPLGPRDGRIALYRRDQAEVLLSEASEYEPQSPVHERLLEHLQSRGACFTFELERIAGAASAADLEASLWDLAWAGVITNDTFLPLRTLGKARSRRRSTARPRRSAYRGGRGGFGRAPSGGGLSGGRWSLVDELRLHSTEAGDRDASQRATVRTQRSYALANVLLERYGIVSREAALAEGLEGGFEALYPVLREMEEVGKIRRGYFVEGLSGRQFALAGAVEQLRALRDPDVPAGRSDDPDYEVLSAVDPANPWGALLPWPRRRNEDGPNPRRIPGAWVVLRLGRPLLYLEAGGRSLVTFRRLMDDSDPSHAIAALRRISARARRRSLRLERIDGEPAGESTMTGLFVQAGFEPDHRGLRLTL